MDRHQNSSIFDTPGSAFFVFARITGVTGIGRGGFRGKGLEGTCGVTFLKGGRIVHTRLYIFLSHSRAHDRNKERKTRLTALSKI